MKNGRVFYTGAAAAAVFLSAVQQMCVSHSAARAYFSFFSRPRRRHVNVLFILDFPRTNVFTRRRLPHRPRPAVPTTVRLSSVRRRRLTLAVTDSRAHKSIRTHVVFGRTPTPFLPATKPSRSRDYRCTFVRDGLFFVSVFRIVFCHRRACQINRNLCTSCVHNWNSIVQK